MHSHPSPEEDDEPLYPTGGALAYQPTRSGKVYATASSAYQPSLPPDEITPRRQAAATDAGIWDETLHANPGSSFEKTLARAFRLHQAGRSVRVILASGIYRGSFSAGPAESDARILIEAAEPGRTIIRGSDVWRDWRDNSGVWHSQWPHKWGLGSAPDTYGDPNLATADLMRRREMIFVNGHLHRQTLERACLEPGFFFVDEANEQILLRPAENFSPREALVEVGIRSGLIDISGRANLTFRGLRLEHDASFYFTPQRAALQLSGCRNVLVEDCAFQWNNTKGLQIIGSGSEQIVLRRVACNHNGCLGILASRIGGLVLENCGTSFNNWRGAWAGKFRGSPCGIKIMRSAGVTLRGHKAIRNLATGIWIDEENRDVRIQNATVYENYRGIHLEAGGGPALVEGSVVVANRQEPLASDFRWSFGSGIAITHMPDVILRDNFIANNDTAQIGVRDDREKRVITDGETGEKRAWRSERLTLEGNTIVAGGTRNGLLHVPDAAFDSGRFLRTFRADGNAYVGSPEQHGFKVGRLSSAIDFTEWKRLTGQDHRSAHEQI